MHINVTIGGNRWRVPTTQDLYGLLVTYCQLKGKNPEFTGLRVARTGETITLGHFNLITVAATSLRNGDFLAEVDVKSTHIADEDLIS